MTATPTVQLTGPALLGVDAVPAARLLTLPAAVKLGRVAPKAEKPVLRLSAYRRPLAAPAPASSGNRRAKAAASLGRMYRNDVQGCCVISSAYHRLGFWSAVDGSPEIQVADSTIDQMYARLKAGPGDSGCIITDVLDYFRSAGMPVGNGRAEKIDGYVSVDNTDAEEVKVALLLFGTINLGIDLPQEWTQAAVWDVTNSPSVGGHDVSAVDYDEKGVYVSSWGRVYLITWRAFTSRRWLGERYAMLAPSWYGDDRMSPLGVDAGQLAADLQKLGGGELPPLPDPNPPPQPPVPPMPTSPTYAVSVSGRIPVLGAVTLTGTAVPKPAAGFELPACQSADPAGLGPLEWLRLMRQVAEFVRWLQQYLASQPQAAAAFPALPPELVRLVLDNVLKLLPVIVAGIQAGKPFLDILQDCLRGFAFR